MPSNNRRRKKKTANTNGVKITNVTETTSSMGTLQVDNQVPSPSSIRDTTIEPEVVATAAANNNDSSNNNSKNNNNMNSSSDNKSVTSATSSQRSTTRRKRGRRGGRGRNAKTKAQQQQQQQPMERRRYDSYKEALTANMTPDELKRFDARRRYSESGAIVTIGMGMVPTAEGEGPCWYAAVSRSRTESFETDPDSADGHDDDDDDHYDTQDEQKQQQQQQSQLHEENVAATFENDSKDESSAVVEQDEAAAAAAASANELVLVQSSTDDNGAGMSNGVTTMDMTTEATTAAPNFETSQEHSINARDLASSTSSADNPITNDRGTMRQEPSHPVAKDAIHLIHESKLSNDDEDDHQAQIQSQHELNPSPTVMTKTDADNPMTADEPIALTAAAQWPMAGMTATEICVTADESIASPSYKEESPMFHSIPLMKDQTVPTSLPLEAHVESEESIETILLTEPVEVQEMTISTSMVTTSITVATTWTSSAVTEASTTDHVTGRSEIESIEVKVAESTTAEVPVEKRAAKVVGPTSQKHHVDEPPITPAFVVHSIHERNVPNDDEDNHQSQIQSYDDHNPSSTDKASADNITTANEPIASVSLLLRNNASLAQPPTDEVVSTPLAFSKTEPLVPMAASAAATTTTTTTPSNTIRTSPGAEALPDQTTAQIQFESTAATTTEDPMSTVVQMMESGTAIVRGSHCESPTTAAAPGRADPPSQRVTHTRQLAFNDTEPMVVNVAIVEKRYQLNHSTDPAIQHGDLGDDEMKLPDTPPANTSETDTSGTVAKATVKGDPVASLHQVAEQTTEACNNVDARTAIINEIVDSDASTAIINEIVDSDSGDNVDSNELEESDAAQDEVHAYHREKVSSITSEGLALVAEEATIETDPELESIPKLVETEMSNSLDAASLDESPSVNVVVQPLEEITKTESTPEPAATNPPTDVDEAPATKEDPEEAGMPSSKASSWEDLPSAEWQSSISAAENSNIGNDGSNPANSKPEILAISDASPLADAIVRDGIPANEPTSTGNDALQASETIRAPVVDTAITNSADVEVTHVGDVDETQHEKIGVDASAFNGNTDEAAQAVTPEKDNAVSSMDDSDEEVTISFLDDILEPTPAFQSHSRPKAAPHKSLQTKGKQSPSPQSVVSPRSLSTPRWKARAVARTGRSSAPGNKSTASEAKQSVTTSKTAPAVLRTSPRLVGRSISPQRAATPRSNNPPRSVGRSISPRRVTEPMPFEPTPPLPAAATPEEARIRAVRRIRQYSHHNLFGSNFTSPPPKSSRTPPIAPPSKTLRSSTPKAQRMEEFTPEREKDTLGYVYGKPNLVERKVFTWWDLPSPSSTGG